MRTKKRSKKKRQSVLLPPPRLCVAVFFVFFRYYFFTSFFFFDFFCCLVFQNMIKVHLPQPVSVWCVYFRCSLLLLPLFLSLLWCVCCVPCARSLRVPRGEKLFLHRVRLHHVECGVLAVGFVKRIPKLNIGNYGLYPCQHCVNVGTCIRIPHLNDIVVLP